MTTRSRVQAIIAASPPLLFALLVIKLWFTGTLGYYVNDRTVWIVLIGGLLFAAVGVIAVRAALRSTADTRLSWRTLAFLLPLLLGLAIPARPLSAATGQASSLGALQLAAHVSSGSPGDAFGYWISSLSDHPDSSWWVGQHATLVGFVSKQVGLPVRSFIVARFLVTCCVVDASLLGFPVQVDRGRLPDEGAWVQVSGVFGQRYWIDPSGAHYPILQHIHVAPVTIPSSPYLSP